MPCYKPLQGYRAIHVNSSGKRPVVFTKTKGFSDLPVTVPCGRCIGCRLERSRQWAIRCVHEASLYEDNSFVTLTYSDENLPPGNSLRKKDFQDFMKRLRFNNPGKRIRYFHCGEYGDQSDRPHYHACIFNHEFTDKKIYSVRDGVTLYISATLEKTWGLGFCTVGAVTFESAAYTARYIMKKVTGEKAAKHYQSMDPETGEIFEIEPEYVTMSRKPGIGTLWYHKYKDDVFPEDFIILNGRKMKPPRFYDGLYEADEKAYRQLKSDRKKTAAKDAANQTRERLDVREKVKNAQVNQLKRTL